jgi:hypothetical protein
MTDVQVPTRPTLARYGFGSGEAALADDPVEDWKALLDSQGGVCGVCGTVPKTGRMNIDHEHVRGWKDMPGEDRRKYVRGIVCWFDNLYTLRRGMTPERALGAAAYLRRYIDRKV